MGSALYLGCSSLPRQRISRSERKYTLHVGSPGNDPWPNHRKGDGARLVWLSVSTDHTSPSAAIYPAGAKCMPKVMQTAPGSANRDPVPRLHLKNNNNTNQAMSNNTIYGIFLHEEEMQRSEMLDLLPPQTGGQSLGRDCSFSCLS